LSTAAADLAGADYGNAAYFDLVGSDLIFVAPLEELVLGKASSF
jgi:hypothetical protein